MKEAVTDCEKKIKRGGWNEERVLGRCEVPIGPRNTYSNLAYIVAGLSIFAVDRAAESILMAVALVALGLGSWAYHAYKTYNTNLLDRIGMLLVAGCLVGMVYTPLDADPALPMGYLAVAFAAIFATLGKRMDISYPMGFVLTAVALPAVWSGGQARGLSLMALAFFALAYIMWHVDKSHKTEWLWGHAAWHVLTAASIFTMFFALSAYRLGM